MRIIDSELFQALHGLTPRRHQESFPQELAEDCDDPEIFKFLAGFADEFPIHSKPREFRG